MLQECLGLFRVFDDLFAEFTAVLRWSRGRDTMLYAGYLQGIQTWCYRGITLVLQRYHSGVTVVLHRNDIIPRISADYGHFRI